MKTNKEYNFRVGDYVEVGTSLDVGYITKITRQLLGNDSDIFYHIEADCTHNVFGKHPLPDGHFEAFASAQISCVPGISKCVVHVAYADCDGEVMLIDSKQAQSHKTNPRVGGA